MTESRGRRVKLLPKVLADVVPIIRWTIEVRLQLIAEVACGLQASGTIAPGKEQAMKRILQSLGTDWKADQEAIVDYLRAEVWEWWQDFPERQLLTESISAGRPTAGRVRLSRQQAPPGSSGRPKDCHATAGRHLGHRDPVRLRVRSPQPFRKFWQSSCCPPSAYAPPARCESTSSAPKPAGPTSALSSAWRRSWTAGARSSPARSTCGGRRLPAGSGGGPPGGLPRPIAPSIQPTSCVTSRFSSPSRLLQRVGVKPNGNVSGCRIVSEALKLSEGNVSLSERSVKASGTGLSRPSSRSIRKPSPHAPGHSIPLRTTEA